MVFWLVSIFLIQRRRCSLELSKIVYLNFYFIHLFHSAILFIARVDGIPSKSSVEFPAHTFRGTIFLKYNILMKNNDFLRTGQNENLGETGITKIHFL